jgi:hypothetical protein
LLNRHESGSGSKHLSKASSILRRRSHRYRGWLSALRQLHAGTIQGLESYSTLEVSSFFPSGAGNAKARGQADSFAKSDAGIF